MAWASELTNDGADQALDRPLVIVPTAPHTHLAWKWSSSADPGYDWELPENSATGFSVRNAFDMLAERQTKAAASFIGANQAWLVVNTANANTRIFDSLVLLNHNLPSVFGAGSTNIVLEIANDSAFTSNLQTIASSTISTTTRVVLPNLSHVIGQYADANYRRRYTDVEFVRLKLHKPTFTITAQPVFGEVMLGRSYQMPRWSTTPTAVMYDSGVEDFEAPSGHFRRVVHFTGRRIYEGRFQFATSAEAQILKDAWAASAYGSRPIVWVDKPATAASSAVLAAWTVGKFEILASGEQTVNFRVVELPPFVSGGS